MTLCCLILAVFLSMKGIAFSTVADHKRQQAVGQSFSASTRRVWLARFSSLLNGGQNYALSDFEATRREIAELRQSRNLYGLVSLADQIEQYWSKKDILRYANLMIDICGAFDSQDFGDPQEYVFARKYAKQALDKVDRMPIELELELVPHLMGDTEYATKKVDPQSWNEDRSERAKYWCHAWKRLNAEYDKNFDFSKAPGADRSLPPDVRRQKQQACFKQHLLKTTYPVFSDQFQRYLANAYSKQPSDIYELKQFLTECVGDAKMRQSILSETRNRLTAKQ